MNSRIAILSVILIYAIPAFSQNHNGNGNGNGNGHSNGKGIKLINLISLFGEVDLTSSYRQQERDLRGTRDESDHFFLMGGLNMNSRFSIWHPNFLTLDLNAEFNPSTNRNNYIVIPDQAEILTSSKVDLRASFFSGKVMNFALQGGYANSFFNREFLTSVRRNQKYGGVIYNYANRFLPISGSYNIRETEHKEVESGRKFKTINEDLQFILSKSFTAFDFTNINFSRTNYRQSDIVFGEIDNTNHNLNFNNTIFFDKKRNYLIRSTATYSDFQGNLDIEQLIIREELILKLPKQFTFTGKYNYSNTKQEVQNLEQHNIYAGLQHQLYQSLNTTIYGRYSENKQALRLVTQKIGGVQVRYNKKLPLGTLNLSYSFRRQNLAGDGQQGSIPIFNEQQVLSDGEIALLDRPFVDPSTVVVRSDNGIIIYQVDFDYQLIPRGNFHEVRRTPGGRIPNGAPVLVDYVSIQPGNFQYDADNQSIRASMVLFDNKLELYYQRSWQDFKNVEQAEFLTLDDFDRSSIGGRIRIKSLRTGAEYNDVKSRLVPYKRMRYFMGWTQKVSNAFMINLNGEVSDYKFTENDGDQLYFFLNTSLGFQINRRNKLTLSASYRNQQGQAIDLNLYSGRLEYWTLYRKLQLVAGAEYYNRDYIDISTEFWGIYLRIKRTYSVK